MKIKATNDNAKGPYIMQVYPAIGGHIAKIIVPTDAPTQKVEKKIPFYCILDRSGSMGQNVKRLVNEMLPELWTKLGYKADDYMELISFDNNAELHRWKLADLKNSTLNARGGTYMSSAINALVIDLKYKIFSQKDGDLVPLRILTLTDGELNDQTESLQSANNLRTLLEDKFLVNSQAVRVFTSSTQPDTRGLTGMMQLSSAKASSIVDINMYDLKPVDIAHILEPLFKDDLLGDNSRVVLTSSNATLLSAPRKEPTSAISLATGKNIFWLKDLPDDKTRFTIGDNEIKVAICPALHEGSYQDLLQQKVDFFLNKLKVLKVMRTTQAEGEITQILDYWTQLDKSLVAEDVSHLLAKNRGLRDRLLYFKTQAERAGRSASKMMAQIANDERVAKLNAAQSADYLRTFEVSAGSKGLARRALASGIDFTSIAHKEVRAMHQHLHELKDIDDTHHHVSFYSQETTLGGIKAVCELVTSNLLEEMDVNDILQLFGIVGIACHAPVGPFPDPMTYRVQKMYPGCKISLADVLTAHIVSHGGTLEVPGEPGSEIVNVVPLFDDERIHHFLRKHAPTLLEYVTSVGMRRQVAEVPRSMAYLLVAGVMSMLEDMAKDDTQRTEIRAETFVKLIRAFRLEIGGHFDHVMPYLVPQAGQKNKPPQSFYIAKNGVTNLMSCFMRILADPTKEEIVKPIMRALYNYECWQQVRKTFRHTENRDDVIAEKMTELLDINIERDKTPMGELFADQPKAPSLHDRYNLNDEALSKLTKRFYYADYITLLPPLLRAAMLPDLKDAVQAIRDAPKLSEEVMRDAFGIDYSIHLFRFYNVAQAFMHPDAADRFADNKSNFIDVVDGEAADAMVKSYVRSKFLSRYRQDIVAHNKEEYRVLTEELINKMCDAETAEEFAKLFREGLSRGQTKTVVNNTSSMGYIGLRDGVTDTARKVPCRVTKIQMMLLGRDAADEPVWNAGNVLFVKDLSPFQNALVECRSTGQAVWDKLYEMYMSRRRHIYRELPNRCGHHNAKPSFWAIGYGTLDEMVQKIGTDEWEEYKKIHHDCCGVPQLLSLVDTRKSGRRSKK